MWQHLFSLIWFNITIDCRRLTSSCLKNKEKSVETGEFKWCVNLWMILFIYFEEHKPLDFVWV
ncbi:hypothetical protein Q604_UNBc4C00203G0001, partial [human gut metagenome]